MKFPLFSDQASTTAQQVDWLYFFLTAVSLVFIALIFLPITAFLVKYRRGHPANRSPLRTSTLKIEIAWTVIPLILTLGMFAWGASLYFQMQRVPSDALELHVVGKQWMWKIQHPTGNREINELHVPVGRTVKLLLASEDVIHSFYLPAFRIKQDAVPGRYTAEWFKATKTGTYHLFCAEYCGTEHSRMTGRVVVMEPADYQAWLVATSVGESQVGAGLRLFGSLGCSMCHRGESPVRAPPVEGLFGSLVSLQNGETVKADEKYIRDSILFPQSQVTAGYDPVMPTYQGAVTEEQILQLIAYLSLAQRTPEERR